MKRTYTILGIAVCIGLLAVIFLSRTARANHEVILTQEPGQECVTTMFEGGGHFTQIHEESGFLIPGTIARFPGWVTLVNTSLSNLPSPITPAI